MDPPIARSTSPVRPINHLLNVVLVGIGFMLIFSAFQTCCMVEQTVLASAKKQDPDFNGNGFISLAVIYIVFSVFNWFAPPIVALVGPKWSMFIGGLGYFLFILSFLKPMTWSLYLGSVIVGLAAPIIWTAQGNFLTINSPENTAGRNAGIFWGLLQCSLLFGNIFVFFEFQGEISIDPSHRTTLFSGLAGANFLGILVLLLLRVQSRQGLLPEPGDGSIQADGSRSHWKEAMETMKQSWDVFRTFDMILLSVCFFYTGLELTFWSGVYTTAVGNTKAFGDEAKRLIGLVGIFTGVGEIVGGAVFGFLGKKITSRIGRNKVVFFGMIIHLAAFFLIFMILPADSPITSSSAKTYWNPNKYLAVGIGSMLGLGDASFNTQCYSILSHMYQDESSSAFALFKFSQSVAAAAAFFYSDYLTLPYQLLILAILCGLGSIAFTYVEQRNNAMERERLRQGYTPIVAGEV